jgi:hypothetical protein
MWIVGMITQRSPPAGRREHGDGRPEPHDAHLGQLHADSVGSRYQPGRDCGCDCDCDEIQLDAFDIEG